MLNNKHQPAFTDETLYGEKKQLRISSLTNSSKHFKSAQQSPLTLVPDEILLNIVQFLSFNDISNCCKLTTFFRPVMTEVFHKQLQLLLYPFLQHIVHGKKNEAKAMLDKYPILLYYSGKVTAYSGRVIKGTAFEIALKEWDVDMCNMIEPFWKKLKNGDKEKQAQYNKVFPKGRTEEQESYDFYSLIRTIVNASSIDLKAALGKPNNKSALCKALNKFRSNFKKLFMQETNFNPQHLQTAFRSYKTELTNWGDFPDEVRAKYKLFWCQVIGHIIQCYFPVRFAQALYQAILKSSNKGYKFNYCLNFKKDAGTSLTPANSLELIWNFKNDDLSSVCKQTDLFENIFVDLYTTRIRQLNELCGVKMKLKLN